MILSSLLAVSLLATDALVTGSAPAVTVEARDGRRFTGAIVAWRDGRLLLTASDGSSVALPGDELLLLHAPPPAPAAPRADAGPVIEPATPVPPPAEDLLLLAGPHGDRLVGHVVGGDENGVRFQLAVGAPFEVDFERIARLLPAARLPVDRLMLLADGGDDDRLWRQRADGGLDSLGGVVDRIEDGRVVFEGALGHMEFPLSEIAAVILAGGDGPDDEPLPGLPVTVRLLGGSRVLAGLLELDEDRLVLATRFAPRLELPAAALQSLVCRGPGRVLLADLVPAEVEQRPTVGGAQDVLFPWRADLSVTGRLLSATGCRAPRASVSTPRRASSSSCRRAATRCASRRACATRCASCPRRPAWTSACSSTASRAPTRA